MMMMIMEVWEEQLEGASYFCSTWGIGCQPRCSGAGRRSGKCCRGNCWWKRAIFRYSILPLDKLFVLSYIDIWLSIDVQNAVTKENQVMADYGGTSKKNTWISAKSMQWRRKWGRLWANSCIFTDSKLNAVFTKTQHAVAFLAFGKMNVLW